MQYVTFLGCALGQEAID